MIFYFSGTGNSKWVAEEIAGKLKDEAVNIADVKNRAYTFTEGQKVGLVFPVYAWSPPQVVMEFAGKLRVSGAFVFGVCTCGDEAGNSMRRLSKVIPLNSSYSIVMPNNYIVGFDVDSEDMVKSKIAAARVRIAAICEDIRKGIGKTEVTAGRLAFLKTSLVAPFFNYFARSTKPFHAVEGCNSCGLCVRVCPLGTIALKDGKPVWRKECYQCLSCINRCPQKAIEYGRLSKGKGRYYFKYE